MTYEYYKRKFLEADYRAGRLAIEGYANTPQYKKEVKKRNYYLERYNNSVVRYGR